MRREKTTGEHSGHTQPSLLLPPSRGFPPQAEPATVEPLPSVFRFGGRGIQRRFLCSLWSIRCCNLRLVDAPSFPLLCSVSTSIRAMSCYNTNKDNPDPHALFFFLVCSYPGVPGPLLHFAVLFSFVGRKRDILEACSATRLTV